MEKLEYGCVICVLICYGVPYIGKMVRFVIVVHPLRGTIFLMGTDLTLTPIDIIKIYGYRFKIEVSFKQILRIIGGYAYHFWMMKMVSYKKRKAIYTFIAGARNIKMRLKEK